MSCFTHSTSLSIGNYLIVPVSRIQKSSTGDNNFGKWKGTFRFDRPKWPDRSLWTTFKAGPEYSGRTKPKWSVPFDKPTGISGILGWMESALEKTKRKRYNHRPVARFFTGRCDPTMRRTKRGWRRKSRGRGWGRVARLSKTAWRALWKTWVLLIGWHFSIFETAKNILFFNIHFLFAILEKNKKLKIRIIC